MRRSLDVNAPYEVQAELLRDFVSVRSAAWHPDGQRISLLGESRRSGWRIDNSAAGRWHAGQV